MMDKTFDRRMAAAREHLEALGGAVGKSPPQQKALLSEAMDELSAALTALHGPSGDAGRRRGEGQPPPGRTLDALQQERRRLFAVLDLLPAFIYLQGRDHSVHFANRRFRELFGDPGHRRCYEVLSGRQAPCQKCPTFRVLENGSPQLWEWVSRAGRTYMVYNDRFPSSDGSQMVLNVGIDVTERKRAAKEIAALAKFPDENPNPVLRISEDGTVLYGNKAGSPLLAVWGCRQGETLSGRWLPFVQDSLQAGRSRQTELECGGRIFSLTFAPVVDSSYVNVYALDITERQRAEEEVRELNEQLEQRVAERTAQLETANRELQAEVAERGRAEAALRGSETKYRELVQNANSIILRVDTQGTITFFNEFAQQFFGYSEQEILGRSAVGTIVPATDTAGRDLTAVVDDIVQHPEGYAVNENENVRRNGERVWIAWTNKAIRDAHGRVVGLLCIGNDITQRKQLEQEVLRVGEMERQHVGRDLHDSLGQTLSGTAYLSQVLQRKLAAKSLPEAADAARIAALLSDSVASAKSLARGLCPIKPGPEGLMTALGELASRVEDLFGISCVFECPGSVLVNDVGVAGHLYRIAQEAAANAVRHGEAGQILIQLARRGGSTLLSVLDDGVGLPKERNGQGGMGVRIMRYRAHAIGASFEARRRPEGGTAVTCRLPKRTEQTDGEEADRNDGAC